MLFQFSQLQSAPWNAATITLQTHPLFSPLFLLFRVVKQLLQKQRCFKHRMLACPGPGCFQQNIDFLLLPVHISVKESEYQRCWYCYNQHFENHPTAHPSQAFLKGMGWIIPAHPIQSWLTSLREEQELSTGIWEMPLSKFYVPENLNSYLACKRAIHTFWMQVLKRGAKIIIYLFYVLCRASSMEFKVPQRWWGQRGGPERLKASKLNTELNYI